ncbi:MAG: DUF4926 domain-containing protein [Anaerolineae bacterium]|nr:DUF4926 domain-containing protein [Anaerolineae bacterium]
MALHDTVALLEDLSDALKRGQVGTVIEEWESGVYEVEFSDGTGITYATEALRIDQLLKLHWQPQPKQDG